jgi:hypothetical protein
MEPQSSFAHPTNADIQRSIEKAHQMRSEYIARSVKAGIATLNSFIRNNRLVSGAARYSWGSTPNSQT